MGRDEKKCADIPFDVVEGLLWARRRFERIAQTVTGEEYGEEIGRLGVAIDCEVFAEHITGLLGRYGYHFMYEDLWDPEEARICALDQIHEEALGEHQRRRSRGSRHR